MAHGRRQFMTDAFGAFGAFALSQLILEKNLLASKASMKVDDWFSELHRIGEGLEKQSNKALLWQADMSKHYAKAPIAEIIKSIDLDKIRRKMDYSKKGECFIRIPMGFNSEDLSHEKRQVVVKVAGVKKGGAVPPHGHENMVSAFMVLDGKLRVRQFDKLYEKKGEIAVKKSFDQVQTPGEWTSVSDKKDNCHWLESVGDEAMFFSTKVVELKHGARVRGRIYFDHDRAKKVGDGILLAEKLAYSHAIERYSK